MQVSYRPTLDDLCAAAREQLRLRGTLSRIRVLAALLLVAGPLALVVNQWLFTVYAVAVGIVLLLAGTTTVLLRRGLRRAPQLQYDTVTRNLRPHPLARAVRP